MSKYADKRLGAQCGWPDCDEPAQHLAILQGVPDWLCDVHIDQVRTRQKETR